MAFFYHRVPINMNGQTLFPLGELRRTHPEIYAKEVKKYDDHPQRQLLPQRIIKKLNCPQADVLHFSPIHPHLMFKGLRSVFPDFNHSSLFFEIPIERINNLPAIIFDMNKTGTFVFGEEEPDEMFELVTPQTYKILETIPQEAIEFYQQWKARGANGAPAMARIAHLMVQGPVSVADCRIIDWKDKP